MSDIIVSKHAIDMFRERRGHDDDEATLSVRQVEAGILECIEWAKRNGRILDHRPEGFVRYRRRFGNALEPGQRFAHCHDDYGFILKKIPEGELVVTMLSRVGVSR